MDGVANFIVGNLSEIARGQPMDLEQIDDITSFAKCAGHCIVNGPVGVGKENAFPSLFVGSIREKFGCRSSQWRETCRAIAMRLRQHPEVVATSLHARLYGDLWPLAEKPNN